jgi:hypothetical protein
VSDAALLRPHRHCEERSDEAIQTASPENSLDCFAALAMMGQSDAYAAFAVTIQIAPWSATL